VIFKLIIFKLKCFFYEYNVPKESAVILKIDDLDEDFIVIDFDNNLKVKFLKNNNNINYYVINNNGIYIHYAGAIYLLHYHKNDGIISGYDFYPISKEKVEHRNGEYYLK